MIGRIAAIGAVLATGAGLIGILTADLGTLPTHPVEETAPPSCEACTARHQRLSSEPKSPND